VAFGLSLALLGLQFLGLAHLTLERHGVCWEHGTLTELGPSRAAPLVVQSGSALPGLDVGTSSARAEDADKDDHCPVQALRRGWATPPAGATWALATEVSGDVALGVPELRADAGLLRRAPKQSPPTA
jgi:hypothetical protein